MSLTAAAQVAGQAVRIERLALASGNARVNAAGSIDEALDLAWSIDARDLGQLLPDAAGSLKGEGRVGGTLQEPLLRR